MPPLVRDALELAMVVALAGMLWSVVARIRRDRATVPRCRSCGRPVSPTYARCPRCATPLW